MCSKRSMCGTGKREPYVHGFDTPVLSADRRNASQIIVLGVPSMALFLKMKITANSIRVNLMHAPGDTYGASLALLLL